MPGNAWRWMTLCMICVIPLLSACGGTPVSRADPTEPMERPTATMPSSHGPTQTLAPSTAMSLSASPTVEPSSTPTHVSTSTPEPSPTTLPLDEVVVRETTISIPAYAYEPYLLEAFDAQRGVPYLWLDRSAYGQPAIESVLLRPFRAVVLENAYLRLTILPELGGRIYECIFKPTGQNIFYRNGVLKPTPWGPLTREKNWWLAAGGMEWAFPVNEHGYEWGLPWSYSIDRSTSETRVTVSDSGQTRLRMRVEIGLASARAYFAIRPHIENPTTDAISYQYWTNAMLTLGSPSMSANTEFVYPTREVIVHSAGPSFGLPAERTRISWPVWEGMDIARYNSWLDWLGFFVPEPTDDFVGAYDHDTGLGVARVFPRGEVPGVKLFAWGPESPYTFEYTDDGSQYFEIWGGPNRTFWPEDDNVLGPGESRSWTEYWYPFRQIGGLDFANRDAALSLAFSEGKVHLGVVTTSSQEGTVVLAVGEEELYRQQVSISPESPHIHQLPSPAAGPVSLTYLGPDGEVVARHESDRLVP